MNKKELGSILGIVILISLIPHAESFTAWIPPTIAFSEIFVGNNHIQAKNYLGNITLIGSGLNITLANGTKTPTITFTETGIVPNIVKNISLKNQTSSISSVTLFTVPTNGVYHVSVYQEDTSSAVAGTLSTVISWTDESGHSQNTNPAPNVSVTISGGYGQGIVYLDAKSGTNISYQTTLSGVTGSPQYNLFITVEKLS